MPERPIDATLSGILEQATAAIGDIYYLLPIHGGNPIYRERVYCYELYHQMRLRWEPLAREFLLNGEVDKHAYPIMDGAGIPDFLIHKPGDKDGNDTIIEVKRCAAPTQGIEKDIRTLERFTHKFGYKRSILLIYGARADQPLVTRVRRTFDRVQAQGPIELWLHPQVRAAARHRFTLRRNAVAAGLQP